MAKVFPSYFLYSSYGAIPVRPPNNPPLLGVLQQAKSYTVKNVGFFCRLGGADETNGSAGKFICVRRTLALLLGWALLLQKFGYVGYCSIQLDIRLKPRVIPARLVLSRLLVAPVQGAEPIRQASPKGHAYEGVILRKQLRYVGHRTPRTQGRGSNVSSTRRRR